MSQNKHRHPLLTGWLLLMMFTCSLGAGLHIMGIVAGIHVAFPGVPAWTYQLLVGLSLTNVIGVFALFRWKKWGFWGLCIATSIALIIKLNIGMPIHTSICVLIGITILYGIFQIGTDNKGWPQLD